MRLIGRRGDPTCRRQLIALTLMQFARAAARERRARRVAALAKRLLLARTLTSWKRHASCIRMHIRRRAKNSSSSRLTKTAPLLTPRRAQLRRGIRRWAGFVERERERLEMAAWLDAMRFNAMGAALDRWRERWEGARRRDVHRRVGCDMRSLLWL